MILSNIRALCERNRVSLSALEKKLDIGNGTIGRWDKSSPTTERLKAVADYFGVTVDELLNDKSAQRGANA